MKPSQGHQPALESCSAAAGLELRAELSRAAAHLTRTLDSVQTAADGVFAALDDGDPTALAAAAAELTRRAVELPQSYAEVCGAVATMGRVLVATGHAISRTSDN